jgi:hypothetical protein
VAASDQALVDELIRGLEERYIISVEKSLETFLGLHMEYLVDGSVLFTQPRRIQELVDEYKIDKSKYPSVPMSSQFNDADQNDSPRCEGLKFMTLLGKLIFLVKTRPDISFAVNRLATRSSVCTMKDYWCLLRIVRVEGTGYSGGRMRRVIEQQ